MAAFVSNNPVRTSDMPDLIASAHAALIKLNAPEAVELKPAVPVKKSISDEYLICLDDGKRVKSLRRHLSSLGMSPDEYRAKWALPWDYPMVAPAYAAQRSTLARARFGLKPSQGDRDR